MTASARPHGCGGRCCGRTAAPAWHPLAVCLAAACLARCEAQAPSLRRTRDAQTHGSATAGAHGPGERTSSRTHANLAERVVGAAALASRVRVGASQAGASSGATEDAGSRRARAAVSGVHIGAASAGAWAAVSSDSALGLSAAMDIAVDALLGGPLRSTATDPGALAARRAREMDLGAAVRAAGPPAEVVSFLRSRGLLDQRGNAGSTASGSDAPAALGTDKLEMAVRTMNNMLETAQKRLDNKVLECKAFRQTNQQVSKALTSDLSRLGQQVANKARIMATTLGSIEQADRSAQQAKESLEREQLAYTAMRRVNEEQLKQREHDLNIT